VNGLQEEDYDSDDETEEKVEVDESETLEGWLDGAEGRDVDSLRASFLDELLEVPFKVYSTFSLQNKPHTPHTYDRTRTTAHARLHDRLTQPVCVDVCRRS
jgi:hypothetical protein